MRNDQVLAAAGSLTFHGACLVGLFFWNTGLQVATTADQGPVSANHEASRGLASVQPRDDAGSGSPTTVSVSKADAESAPTRDSAKVIPRTQRKPGTATTAANAVVEGSYSWPDGEKRKKVSGVLPRPLNAGLASQVVSLDLQVSPNGTVHAIKVVDPSGTGFEREAVRVLRRWRFEVLPRTKPQRDQRCSVTLRVKV